jgi:hypothetical protein
VRPLDDSLEGMFRELADVSATIAAHWRYTLRVLDPRQALVDAGAARAAAIVLRVASLTSDAPASDVFPHIADVGLFAADPDRVPVIR